MTALRREGEWGVGSAKAGTMKGEQGNGEGEGSDGRSTLMDTRVGGDCTGDTGDTGVGGSKICMA